ncbi:Formylglycine-generating sulfatase enzyme [Streptomyces malaysiensis subsp. malaysiensis]|nr:MULTISPECIES: SUMF1/EgtB/PvdO family nonheme iron enzyme [unclassified Streptomyces]AUA11246.1 Formylglycine-generating sulfatase enzyme [Streptomyces sp. M56]
MVVDSSRHTSRVTPLLPCVPCRSVATGLSGPPLRAGVTSVGERPGNRSPFGILDMVGNCWEWTSTTLSDPGAAVICGGSYDNPMRAVQTSSKGVYRKHGGSNAVGFRCVQDIDSDTSGTEETTA